MIKNRSMSQYKIVVPSPLGRFRLPCLVGIYFVSVSSLLEPPLSPALFQR